MTYDAIVIGTGQGGAPLARDLAVAGWATAIIEREHVGGTCVNVGCTPTKTMVASARVAYMLKRAREFGVMTDPGGVDMGTVRERKREMVTSFSDGSRRRLETTPGLDLIMGDAAFRGPKGVDVHTRNGKILSLEGKRIFINVGCGPAVPDLPGLDAVEYLDSTSIMELDAIPDHLLILGGGYIGVEFGQMFRRFGARVTIVQRGGQLLVREDRDVADEVAAILREDGIRIVLEAEGKRVAKGKNGSVRLTVATAEGESMLEGSHLLVAAGRTPRTGELNLDRAGVVTDRRGFILVNDRLETSAEGIYALGDVKGGPMFTHISYDDYRILRTNLLEGGNTTTGERMVPYTVFMDPELGRVGLTEREARASGRPVRIARLPVTGMSRALETGEARGFLKAVVDAGNDQILGCAMLGPEGGELMCMVQIAMMGNLTWRDLKDAIFAHPTRGEALNNLFMAL